MIKINKKEEEIEIIDLITKTGRYFHFAMGAGRYRLMSVLLEHGGNMEQKELQELMGIQSGSVSEIISKICSGDMITRRRSERDGRQMVISLTEEGEREAKRICAEFESRAEEIFPDITAEERRTLVELLTRIHEKIQQT